MAESLTELRAFVRVVESGSFSAAARSLALSTAMVSRHVTALENRLGVRLLDRNTRRSATTDAGRVFYERCAELLESLAEAEAEAARVARALHGTLRISMPVELANLHLGAHLPVFMQRHPDLALALTVSNRVVDIVEEGLDASLRFVLHADPAQHGRQFARTRLELVATTAWIARHGRPADPRDVALQPGLVYGQPSPWSEFGWTRADGAKGVLRLQPRLVSSSTDLLLQAALQDAGLAMLPTMLCGRALREGRLERLLPDHDFGSMRLLLLVPHRRHPSAKLRAFTDFLLECFGADPDDDPFVRGLARGHADDTSPRTVTAT